MTETAVIPHTQCIEVKISHILRSSLVSPCYAINLRTCNRLALDLAEGCYQILSLNDQIIYKAVEYFGAFPWDKTFKS